MVYSILVGNGARVRSSFSFGFISERLFVRVNKRALDVTAFRTKRTPCVTSSVCRLLFAVD